ncbi:MAG: 16S rRNA (uracil(1498)-N(3))-methyltransferase [Rhizobiaceae bacterium]|nr:16S rRNA (uracil(1498)-N(3))-methyltransferase [Rhizobiaceae bacterium]
MPSHDFKSPRLFTAEALGDGLSFEASAEQANYLLNVLRLDEGAAILLFNGREGEWRADLSRPSKKRLVLRPLARIRDQTPIPTLHYLFAPLKSARLDYMVQKAVEMGAGRLQPVMTQHVQAPRINVERMRANAIEAAEQCGILSVPDCCEMMRLADVLDRLDPARTLLFCDEREAEASPIDYLRREPRGPISLLIGPEGGFSEEERRLLRSTKGVLPISLGPRILRADTAAVAALAVVQAAIGDWDGSSPR